MIITTPPLVREANRFQLLNGTWLEGYPKDPSVQNEPVQPAVRSPRQTAEEECRPFYSHAFLFWEKRDLIYSDSRLFLTEVPSRSGLAYMGTGGFQRPTLGVYLEWWERCPKTHVVEPEERFLWYLAGSPLSGCNVSASVFADGRTEVTPTNPFYEVFVPFVHINNRYKELKDTFRSYTLEEAISILSRS